MGNCGLIFWEIPRVTVLKFISSWENPPNIWVSALHHPKFHLQFYRIEKSLVFACLAFFWVGALVRAFRFSIKPLSNTLSLLLAEAKEGENLWLLILRLEEFSYCCCVYFWSRVLLRIWVALIWNSKCNFFAHYYSTNAAALLFWISALPVRQGVIFSPDHS